MDLHLSISNGFVSSKISDDFDFNTVNFLYFFLFYFIFFGGGDLSVLPLMVLTFLKLFGLLEYLVMSLTSMHVMKF